MTNLEINQLLHERVLGLCWHEWEYYDASYSVVWEAGFNCRKCGEEVWVDYGTMPLDPSYTSSWADYGRLLEKFKTLDCFGDFIDWLIESDELNNLPLDNALIVVFDILTCLKCDDRHGARIIAEFVKERGI